jgi:hypothetical protein
MINVARRSAWITVVGRVVAATIRGRDVEIAI